MPENSPRPMIVLDWDLWCGRHLEPYHAAWPGGAAVAMVRLCEVAVKMPAVIDASGGDATRITETLQRFRPLCCFITRDQLQAIYDETLPAAGGS
jgi:hypothetical protein